MNICAEVPKGNMKNSDTLKYLTGNDKFMGEYKGVQGFSMRNYAKLLFSANELPGFRDLSGGFAARLVVIKAINGNQRKEDATFFKKHPIEELKEEAPAFARSCIQEFRKVFDGNHAIFTRSEQMENDRLEWLYDNDYLEQFIEESCTITAGDDKGTSVKLLMEEYKEFCKLAGVWSE
ncbi:MAG: DNA primase, partial [Lactococcus sp.]|nr:DNA primase [Lactococcus sp.]